MRDSQKIRDSFCRLYKRHPATPEEYQAYVKALELKISFNRGAMTVGEIRTQLDLNPEWEDHYFAIVKAETEKQQREQNA